jgi:hypothetical protein
VAHGTTVSVTRPACGPRDFKYKFGFLIPFSINTEMVLGQEN